MEKNIKFLKLVLDKEEIDAHLKNITKNNINLKLNKIEYSLNSDSILKINFTKKEFITFCKFYNKCVDLDFNTVKGFGENSFVETKTGPKYIKDISVDELILDSNGEEILVKNILIFNVNDKNEKIINIGKSKCGINLPYNDLIISIKNKLKKKKILLKGRNLFLNGKAIVIENNNIQLYNIETENKKDFLINGFIVESI